MSTLIYTPNNQALKLIICIYRKSLLSFKIMYIKINTEIFLFQSKKAFVFDAKCFFPYN